MIDNTLNAGVTSTPAYKVAYSMYVAVGGDPTVTFETVEDIYTALNAEYSKGNNRVNVEALNVEYTDNGVYLYDNEAVTGYKPVNIKVEVPQKYTDEQVENIRVEAENNGYNNGYGVGMNDGYNTGYTEGFEAGEDDGYADGYAEGLDDGAEDQKALLEDITITTNGVYEKEDGYKKVKVEVEGGDTGKPKIYNGFQFSGGDIAQVDFSQYDWSNVYDTSYFFEKCSHSTGDWSNFLENYNGKILSGYGMFSNCSALTSIPQLDTSNMVDMSNMFEYCGKITSIPQLDTSNAGNMSYMFYNCGKITSIPQLDTSNVVDMQRMFYLCSALTSIPQLDTSNVTSMSNMLQSCSKLTSIQKLYCGKITFGSGIDIFGSAPANNITYLGGFEDLGKVLGFSKPSYFLKYCPNLTKDSVMNVINNLYDRASAGYSVVALPFNTNSLALLSDEEKAIATNKGWTLATS